MSSEPIVLVIEDDPDWREIIQRRLHRFSCIVEIAENQNQVGLKITQERLLKYSLITDFHSKN